MALRKIIVMATVLTGLAAALFVSLRPAAIPAPDRPPLVWSVEPDTIRTVGISLPREGIDEAWSIADDGHWYFRSDSRRVAAARWGLGVPLLLSGPRSVRLIDSSANDDRLSIYGLDVPRIRVDLVMADGNAIAVELGDRTPDGSADYVRVIGEPAVYSIHRTFAEVVERLVREPPREEPEGAS